MEFPNPLIKRNRKQYPNSAIRKWHYMYARHKNGAEWNDVDGFPAFHTIKAEQSFNWSVFSIPIWVRFTGPDGLVYSENYGIVSYKVKGIIEKKQYNNVEKKYFTLVHIPEETNYSHCQLESVPMSKVERRTIRMTLKHCCQVIVKPNEAYNNGKIKCDILKMKLEQITMKLLNKCQK